MIFKTNYLLLINFLCKCTNWAQLIQTEELEKSKNVLFEKQKQPVIRHKVVGNFCSWNTFGNHSSFLFGNVNGSKLPKTHCNLEVPPAGTQQKGRSSDRWLWSCKREVYYILGKSFLTDKIFKAVLYLIGQKRNIHLLTPVRALFSDNGALELKPFLLSQLQSDFPRAVTFLTATGSALRAHISFDFHIAWKNTTFSWFNQMSEWRRLELDSPQFLGVDRVRQPQKVLSDHPNRNPELRARQNGPINFTQVDRY